MYDPQSSFVAPPTTGGVSVANLSQAKRFKRRFDAVLTAEDPKARQGLRFHEKPAPAHCVLVFEDLDQADPTLWGPDVQDIAKALAFARAHTTGSLLVHCHQGIARSTALALAVLADRLGPGHERQAVEALWALRPCACPNQQVVAYADALLDRQGRLVQELHHFESTVPALLALRAQRRQFVQTHRELYAQRLP